MAISEDVKHIENALATLGVTHQSGVADDAFWVSVDSALGKFQPLMKGIPATYDANTSQALKTKLEENRDLINTVDRVYKGMADSMPRSMALSALQKAAKGMKVDIPDDVLPIVPELLELAKDVSFPDRMKRIYEATRSTAPAAADTQNNAPVKNPPVPPQPSAQTKLDGSLQLRADQYDPKLTSKRHSLFGSQGSGDGVSLASEAGMTSTNPTSTKDLFAEWNRNRVRQASASATGASTATDKKSGRLEYDPAVEEAQKLMTELAQLDGNLKINLATQKKPDGIDGLKGPKTIAAIIAAQTLLADPASAGEITPEFLEAMKQRIATLKAGPAADAKKDASTPEPQSGERRTSGPSAESQNGSPPPNASAPKAPVLGPNGMTLQDATTKAEQGLGILKKLLDMARSDKNPIPAVSEPGQAGGEFDAQSQQSLREMLVALEVDGNRYTPEIGQQLKAKLLKHEQKDFILNMLNEVGGVDKLVDAFDTLYANDKLTNAPVTTTPRRDQFNQNARTFPVPKIDQQQANLLNWAVGNNPKASVLTNELLRLYGGHGIETIYPGQEKFLPGFNRGDKPALPPKTEQMKRVSQSLKDMLDDGVSFDDARKSIMKNMEAVFQVAGYPDRANAFRRVLDKSFDVASSKKKSGESNENIVKEFEQSLKKEWSGPDVKYPTPFQRSVAHHTREIVLAQSAYDAVPGEAGRRLSTRDPLGLVDIFMTENNVVYDNAKQGLGFVTPPPVYFKDAKGDVCVMLLGRDTNILSVEKITAAQLKEIHEFIAKEKTIKIVDPSDEGKAVLAAQNRRINNELVAKYPAYAAIRQTGGVQISSDPEEFLRDKLLNAPTLDDLRKELGSPVKREILESTRDPVSDNQRSFAGAVAGPHTLPDEPGRSPGGPFGPRP